jgi:gliding motility-associated-like protein
MLTVTDPIGGCSGIDTITLFVDPSKNIFVPNAFSPNGDGINDVYSVYASGPVKVFEIEIFNRWGEKVYQSNDMGSGWDGKYMGTFVMPGEYVYQVTFTFLDGQTLANKGSLTVLR